jgi:hypothetical protein
MRMYWLTSRLSEQLSGFLQHNSVNLPSGPGLILATWNGLPQRYLIEYKLAVNVYACEFWKGGIEPSISTKATCSVRLRQTGLPKSHGSLSIVFLNQAAISLWSGQRRNRG